VANVSCTAGPVFQDVKLLEAERCNVLGLRSSPPGTGDQVACDRYNRRMLYKKRSHILAVGVRPTLRCNVDVTAVFNETCSCI
jgi:hypothetical protein